MTELLAPIERDTLLELIDAVVYADVFGSAVTVSEVRRYARTHAADLDELVKEIRSEPALQAILVERDGVVVLRGREELLDQRGTRQRRSEVLATRARRVARVLRHVPFVREVGLTGSVAADDAREDADVDMIVIVGGGRIGTVFLLLGSVSRLLGRRVFCPNFYVSDGHLAIDPSSVYVERELAQTRPLVGDLNALHAANPWLMDVFPNLSPAPSGPEAGGLVQRILESGLRVGSDRLERWARAVAHRRLRVHYQGVVPADVVDGLTCGESLRFHNGGLEHRVPELYAARRREVVQALEQRPVAERGVLQEDTSV